MTLDMTYTTTRPEITIDNSKDDVQKVCLTGRGVLYFSKPSYLACPRNSFVDILSIRPRKKEKWIMIGK